MKPSVRRYLTEVHRLCEALFYPDDDSPGYPVDRWQSAHARLLRCLHALSPVRGCTAREEGELCLALLKGYSAAVGRPEGAVQGVLDRSRRILPLLPPSLLKCSLLTFCYAEVRDESLACEALSIMAGWRQPLSVEEGRVAETLAALREETQYYN